MTEPRSARETGAKLVALWHEPTQRSADSSTRRGLALALPDESSPGPRPPFDVAAHAAGGAGWLLYRKRYEVRPRFVLIDCQGHIGWVGQVEWPHDEASTWRQSSARRPLSEEGDDMGSSQATGGHARIPNEPRPWPRASQPRPPTHGFAELRRRAMLAMAQLLGADVRSVTPDAVLVDDLRADSLQMVEVALAFEEMFGVEFRDEQIERVRTVGDALACLEAAVQRREQGAGG